MKRLVFCFDGTWNRIDAAHPTNVLFTAESVIPIAPDGVTQLVYYDEGVGTGEGEWLRGGAFGAGIEKNLNDAYRFLVFNHTPGDEIYLFGFSRGAFTARSFAGLIARCGVLSRERITLVNKMMDDYFARTDNASFEMAMRPFRMANCPDVCISDAENDWRQATQPGYLRRPLLGIRYVGVWDTVGSRGIPKYILGSSLANRKYEFHDLDLSPSFARPATPWRSMSTRSTSSRRYGRTCTCSTGRAKSPRTRPKRPTSRYGSPETTGLSVAAATSAGCRTRRSTGSGMGPMRQGCILIWPSVRPSVASRRGTTFH